MKKYTRILSYIALFLVIVAIYLRLNQNNDLKNKIIELKKANDSLNIQIDSTHLKITKLNSVAESYKIQIQEDQIKLAELQAKADLYKRKYNEEHNRISGLSGDALINEFTNAFN